MRMRLAVVGVSLLLVGRAAIAGDHLVPAEAAGAALRGAAAARQADLAALDRFLSTPEATRVASSLGVDPRQLRGASATLSDGELGDLATRAAALETDPAAGLSHDVDELLVIFLIVAIVILVIKAV
ncbi:MAG: hypothetical protein ACHQNV_04670 [Vicinamibacteria bacterium]